MDVETRLFLGLIVRLYIPTFDPANSLFPLVPGTGIRRRVLTSKRPQNHVLPNGKIGHKCHTKIMCFPLVLDVDPLKKHPKRDVQGDLPQQSWSLEVSFSGDQLWQFWWCEMMRPLFPTFMASSMSNPPTPTMSRTSMLSLVGNPRKVLVILLNLTCTVKPGTSLV